MTATVHRIDWTGYEGAAGPPVPIAQVVSDPGRLEISIDGPDRMAAYWIAITPGEAALIGPPPWKGQWDAEAADITSGVITRHGHADDGNAFAASGEHDVSGLNMNGSAVVFQVQVPEAGAYDLAVFYAHMYGRGAEATEPQPAQQVLTVNGAERFVDYPSTMNWQHRSIVREAVTLRAGSNTVELSKSGAIGTARGEVALDKIELTERRGERTSYDPAFARPHGDGLAFDLYAAARATTGSRASPPRSWPVPRTRTCRSTWPGPCSSTPASTGCAPAPSQDRSSSRPPPGPRPIEVDAASHPLGRLLPGRERLRVPRPRDRLERPGRHRQHRGHGRGRTARAPGQRTRTTNAAKATSTTSTSSRAHATSPSTARTPAATRCAAPGPGTTSGPAR